MNSAKKHTYVDLNDLRDASLDVRSTEIVLRDNLSEVINQQDVQQKVISAKSCMINKLILLQDNIYIKFTRFGNGGKEIGSPFSKNQISERDSLMMCLDTRSMRSFLFNMAKSYKSSILSAPDEYDDLNNSIVITIRKICVGKWKIHLATSCKLLLDETINQLLFCQSHLDYILVIGSSIMCAKLTSKANCSILPVILGGFMGFKVSNGHINFFKNIARVSSSMTPIHSNGSPIIVFTAIKPQKILKSKRTIITKHKSIIRYLQFSKREIACIIGRKGSRLTKIRETTGCNIKILPLSHDIINTMLSKDIIQTITISGTPDSVEMAIATISDTINRYRNSSTKFI